jgi:hypothetical protein
MCLDGDCIAAHIFFAQCHGLLFRICFCFVVAIAAVIVAIF